MILTIGRRYSVFKTALPFIYLFIYLLFIYSLFKVGLKILVLKNTNKIQHVKYKNIKTYM